MVAIILSMAALIIGAVWFKFWRVDDCDTAGGLIGSIALSFTGFIFTLAFVAGAVERNVEAVAVVAKHATLSEAATHIRPGDANKEDVLGEIVKFNVWLAEYKAWRASAFVGACYSATVADLPLIKIEGE